MEKFKYMSLCAYEYLVNMEKSMNKKGEICLGMAGAGRATELHMNALTRYSGVLVRFKLIIVGPCSADRKRQSLNTLADYENYLTKYTTGFLFFQGYTW